MTTEGAVPEVAGAGVAAGATASEQAFGDKPTRPTGDIHGGMYEPREYEAACTAAGMPDKWDPRYVRGHTAARQWVQPYEGRYDHTFELKHGESASQAVQDFVAGPTITDYRTIGVAIEMDELRDNIGNQRFDEMFGSKDSLRDAKIPAAQRLKISSAMFTTPWADLMLAMVRDNEALDKQSSEPEAPAIAANVEQTPTEATASHAAPELIAAELGIQPEHEHV